MAEKTPETANRAARDLYQKALGALERNNLDYAIAMFRQALDIEPNFIQARRFLRAAQTKQAGGGAFSRLKAAAMAAGHLTKAKLAIGKNPNEAMAIIEEVLTTDPRNAQALLYLAEAAEAGGHHETTVQSLEYYVKLNPRDTKNMHWLGREYCHINEYEKARDIYEQILQIKPNDFEAVKAIKDVTAHGAMHGGGWQEATSYRDVMKDKDEAVALEQQARVVRAEDMTENLLQEKLAKLAADPGNPVLKREVGRLYAQKADYDKAFTILTEVYQSEAGADPTLEREIADLGTKRLEHQIKAKQAERTAYPGRAAAIDREIAALEKERSELALSEARRLVERYPNDLLYRFELAILLMKCGDHQAAIEQFQRAVGQPQKRIASLNYLGQCFYAVGLFDLAIEQYNKAIEETPTMDNLKKDLIYNLGTAFEAMGENEKAVAEFKKIAAVDYGFRDVREKIVRKPA